MGRPGHRRSAAAPGGLGRQVRRGLPQGSGQTHRTCDGQASPISHLTPFAHQHSRKARHVPAATLRRRATLAASPGRRPRGGPSEQEPLDAEDERDRLGRNREEAGTCVTQRSPGHAISPARTHRAGVDTVDIRLRQAASRAGRPTDASAAGRARGRGNHGGTGWAGPGAAETARWTVPAIATLARVSSRAMTHRARLGSGGPVTFRRRARLAARPKPRRRGPACRRGTPGRRG